MRYEVTHGRWTSTVTDDRTVVAAAAVTGRLVDAASGDPLRGTATLRVDHAGMRGRVVDGGWFAISALPEVDLPHLATEAYTVAATVSAPTFDDLELVFALPAGSSLPLEAGDVAMRRRPVRVTGRVTHRVTGDPVTGALVFATALPAATPLLAARWPLRFAHDAGVVVRRRRLDDTATATTLTAAVRGGERVLPVAARSGLAADHVVRLGDGADAQVAVLATVSSEPADPAQPGTLELTAPLHRGAAAGGTVRRLDPAVVPQSRTLAADARAGDGVLLLSGAIAPDGIDTVEVADPGRVEYLVLGAVTDPGGYYRLDGVGAVSGLRLVARAAGFLDGTRTLTVDYGTGANVVNVHLEP